MKNKAINNFMRDATDAAKIAGSHVPGVNHALEGYEIARTASRLSKSTPRAAKAVGRIITRRVAQQPRGIVRKLRRLF